MIKKNIIKILNLLSKVVYNLIPSQFRPNGDATIPLLQILHEKKTQSSYDTFHNYFKTSVLFSNIETIRKYAIEKSLINDESQNYLYLEFGVHKGTSANFFSNYIKKLYAFDSFEGLREDWKGNVSYSKGHFNLNKEIPKLKSNIEPIVGWVQDTVRDFLKKKNKKINFINMDLDTYESSKYVLEEVKPYLAKNCIIIFDELYNYIGWEEGEFKALKEVFNDDEYDYRAFNLKDQQVVIQIK
jgi:hypothetical protein